MFCPDKKITAVFIGVYTICRKKGIPDLFDVFVNITVNHEIKIVIMMMVQKLT